jgi:hypothetical protein
MQAEFRVMSFMEKSGEVIGWLRYVKQLRHLIRIMPEIAPLQKASSQQL